MQELKSSFISNFIDDNRWRYITDGLKITLLVTVFAVLIGVVLGFLIAIVIMAGIREKIEYNDISESFQGTPIVLITACLMAIAFCGFSGLL